MSALDKIARGMERRASLTLGITGVNGAASGFESALLTGESSYAGRAVTPNSAMRVATVYAAVRILAEAVRICPLQVMRPAQDGRRYSPATDNRLWDLMSVAPNPEIPASEMWELLAGHLAVHGNAFIFKERDAGGRVVRLWPLTPQQVIVGRYQRQKVYGLFPWEIAGLPPYDLPPVGTAEDIIHLRWFGTNGLVGLSPIRQLQEDIALEDGHTEFAGSVQKNNATPGGLLTTDEKLSDEAALKLSARWRRAHEGSHNAARVAVLESGLKWQTTSLSLVDAEFIRQRQLSVQSIARGWRIPASMFLAEAGSSMQYSTTEQEGRAFLTYTLQPILDRIAAPLTADPSLQLEPGLRFSFDTDVITSVNMLDRVRATVALIMAGVKSRNEGRTGEGLAHVEGLDNHFDPGLNARITGNLETQQVLDLLLEATNSPRQAAADAQAITALVENTPTPKEPTL